MLTLYFAPGSSSMAVHIALHEIGVAFDGRPMSFKNNDVGSPGYLALNPEGFAGSERYGARMTHIAEKVTTAKGMPGAELPRLPGSRGHAVKRKASSEGIAMFDNLRTALKNVAGMIESPPA